MRSMFIRLLLCFGLLILFPFSTLGAPIVAHEAAYGLKKSIAGKDRIAVSIFNLKTQRVVWKAQILDVQQVNWTPDHRAVVIVEPPLGGPSEDDPYRLIVWEAGKKTRIFSHLRFSVRKYSRDQTALRGDILAASCITQVLLSPDKKRLLIKASWSEGPATVGWGELWCLTLASRHLQQVCPEVEDDARWLSPHRVQCGRVENILKPNGDLLRISTIKTRYAVE